MPLPVIAGIPWLASLIGGLFSGIFTFAATYLTKRLAIVAAAVVIIVGLTVGLHAALLAMVSSLALVIPPQITALSAVVLPSNLLVCLTIYASARMLRFAYDWNIKIIQYKLF